jgi:Uma2 family endonuclease
MGLALRDDVRHTYGEYLTWPEDVRYELIDGVAYLMAPAPTTSHQEVVLDVASQIKRCLQGRPCRVLVAPVDVRLPKGDEADEAIDTVVQPDVLVVCDPAKIGERGVRGAPDWILEVLSPATAGHDQVRKRRIYERSGVREYWMVHPADRVLTVYRLEGGAYGKPDTQLLEGETPVAALPGVTVAWDELAARLPRPDYYGAP